jgi:choline dehydrogenase-like flavoprotein
MTAGSIIEGQTLTSDLNLDCDVCIVGSGPGGAVAASVLVEAGLRVVMLEEGGYFTKERFRQREDDAYPYLYQDGGARATKDLSVTVLQGKTVGGGSVVNWTTCFRTPGDVLKHWKTKHDVGGVDEAALVPHWEIVEKRLSIAPIPLELVNRNNRTLYDGCRALGYDVDVLKRNVSGCAHTGSCGMGCPIDAKQSMLVTYIPDAVARGLTVVARCKADRIVYDQEGRAAAVEADCIDGFGLAATGVKVRITPRVVVVSGGAINSPSLLLRSGTKDPHDVLGRRTFLQPVTASVGFFKDKIDGFRGAPQSVASHHFAHRNNGADVGFFLEATPMHPMLAATAAPGMGNDHASFMKQLPYLAGHLSLAIDGFHDDVPGGRVMLQKDGSTVLDYVIAPRVWDCMRAAQKVMAQVQFAAGATQVGTLHDPIPLMKSPMDVDRVIDALPFRKGSIGVFTAHQMGGCGMSDNAKKGVVRSEDARHHQVENLYVIDGSLFPTSLGVNPQLSIYGLSRLMSTRLVETLKRA